MQGQAIGQMAELACAQDQHALSWPQSQPFAYRLGIQGNNPANAEPGTGSRQDGVFQIAGARDLGSGAWVEGWIAFKVKTAAQQVGEVDCLDQRTDDLLPPLARQPVGDTHKPHVAEVWVIPSIGAGEIDEGAARADLIIKQYKRSRLAEEGEVLG